MAHNVMIGRWTEQLVTAFAHPPKPVQSDNRSSEDSKIDIDQLLLFHKYGRTNHFEVHNHLLGLDEKLRVLNNDEVADALRLRLKELSTLDCKSRPELLSLLLLLSDRPAVKASVEDLEVLRPLPSPPALTWEDILEDDPLEGEAIWGNVDFTTYQSDEDSELDAKSELSLSDDTRSSQFEKEQDLAKAQACILGDDGGSEGRTQAQSRRLGSSEYDKRVQPSDQRGLVTEQHIIRETMFMLSGLPTSLYMTRSDGSINVASEYYLADVSSSTLERLLFSSASMGTELGKLRKLAAEKHQTTLMQTLASAVEERLRFLTTNLSKMQQRVILRNHPIVISLIQVQHDIWPHIRPLLSLAKILCISSLTVNSDSVGFRHLEHLFEVSCTKQMIGDEVEFEFMARLFFQCFQIFLRPIQQWMRTGEIHKLDDTLFICRTDASADMKLEDIWQKWFALRKTGAGELFLPRFLHPNIDKIVTTGKSVAFLRQLAGASIPEAHSSAEELKLDFDTLYEPDAISSLVPFSEVFARAFEGWIASHHQSASTILQATLFSQCGLRDSLDALEYIFLARDGALSSGIARTMFESWSRGDDSWRNRLRLTELHREAFGHLDCFNRDRLACRVLSATPRSSPQSVAIFTCISWDYTLDWPIRNIIPDSALLSYQQIATLLLQIRYAIYLVEHRSCPSGTSRHMMLLRHRLLWFSTTIYHHLTCTVLASCTTSMRRQLSTAEDVDAMIKILSVYTQQLVDGCLLSKRLKPIHDAIISTLDLTLSLTPSDDGVSQHDPLRQPPIDVAECKNVAGDEATTMPPGRPQKSLKDFHTLLTFLISGLRSIARTAGHANTSTAADAGFSVFSSWEGLADRLDWNSNG